MTDHTTLRFAGADIQVIRSARRTLALEIKRDRVLVRAPAAATDQDIEAFLRRHRDWLMVKLRQQEQRKRSCPPQPPLTPEDIHALADRARAYIPGRVAYYAPRVGVSYGRVTIRNQRTRWGSCSSKGNLNFNCLLMLMPPEVIDSVVVHELCHRKEMNHSPRFYAQVRRVFPEYDRWHGWLREHGEEILRRMVGEGE